MWLARLYQYDWKEEYQTCRKNLKILEAGLKQLSIPSFSHPFSLITIFPEPSSLVCDHFQLATHKNWAHICMMPHTTIETIEYFLHILRKSGDHEKMANFAFKTESGWPVIDQ